MGAVEEIGGQETAMGGMPQGRPAWRKAFRVAIVTVGALWLASMPIIIVRQHRIVSATGVCHVNLQALAAAFTAYAVDNGGVFPPVEGWCERLTPYLADADTFVCPAAGDQPCGYAYNAALAAVSAHSIAEADKLVLVFESDHGWNAAGGPELLASGPRHRGLDICAFADGHVEQRLRDGPRELIWEPIIAKPADADAP